MPLINVIRGQEVPHAPLNLRTPVVRVPVWASLGWWCVKAAGRLVLFAVRHWYVTVPVVVLLLLWVWFGWYAPLVAVGVTGAGLTGWGLYHRASFSRLVWWPLLSRWRRAVVGREWVAAMSTAGLAVQFDNHVVLPILRRLRSRGATDTLTVRMVSGQIPDDYAKVGDRLAATFGARSARVIPGQRPDLVTIILYRGDPLARVVDPLAVPERPNFGRLPVALGEDGAVWFLCLFGTQVLVVGATGAGKGSVIWALIRALVAGIRTGLVELWGIDPKGGVELGAGASLFTRLACDDYVQMVELLEEAAAIAKSRAARLRGNGRLLRPTTTDPLIVVVIDELANLTAYLTDRQLRERVKAALGVVLSQGRAVGVHVVACLQDPRKEVVPFRNLFPTRIALRLSEASEVDLVLGDGMRERGAVCDRIPQTSPGVGYVVVDGEAVPLRVRFPYLSDEDIAVMARDYAPGQRPNLRVVDGGATEGSAA